MRSNSLSAPRARGRRSPEGVVMVKITLFSLEGVGLTAAATALAEGIPVTSLRRSITITSSFPKLKALRRCVA